MRSLRKLVGFLRLKLSSQDRYVLLCEAFQRRDWELFLLCLNEEPRLHREIVLGMGMPMYLALISNDPAVVRAVISSGGNPDEVWHGFSDEMPQLVAPCFPGHEVLPYTTLAAAKALGCEDVYADLLKSVRPETVRTTFWIALMTGQEEWATALSAVTFSAVWNENDAPPLGIPAPFAVLFGGGSLSMFEFVWGRTPASHRKRSVCISTVPPGHEEGEHPQSPEGDISFWARHLKRHDVVSFLGADPPP